MSGTSLDMMSIKHLFSFDPLESQGEIWSSFKMTVRLSLELWIFANRGVAALVRIEKVIYLFSVILKISGKVYTGCIQIVAVDKGVVVHCR